MNHTWSSFLISLFFIKTFLYRYTPTYVKSLIMPKIALKAGIQNYAWWKAKSYCSIQNVITPIPHLILHWFDACKTLPKFYVIYLLTLFFFVSNFYCFYHLISILSIWLYIDYYHLCSIEHGSCSKYNQNVWKVSEQS